MNDKPDEIINGKAFRPSYKWQLLALLFFTFFLHQGDRAIFGVVLSSIKTDLQLTDAQLGLVGSALFFTLALLVPVAGYLGDIWSRKWIITVSLMFWSAATMVTGAARGLVSLILFRSIATAGGESFYAPSAYSLIAVFHKKTRAFALAIHQSSLYVGVITSGFLGGYIAEMWGWRSAFYVFGFAGIVLGVVLMLRLKDVPRDTSDGRGRVGLKEAFGVVLRTRTAWLLTTGFVAIVFVNNAYIVWAPNFVQQKFNLSLTVAGGYSMLYHHIAAMIGVLIGGKLSDAMVPSRRQFRLQLQTISMLLGAPMIFLMGQSSTLVATWVTMAAMGFFRGLYEANTHASLFDVIEPRYRASAVGVMTTIGFLAGSASPLLMGYCRRVFGEAQGLSYGFSALSIAYVLGGIAMLVALKFTFHRDYYSETPEHQAGVSKP